MSNEDQIEYWNDSAGQKWAEEQLALDAMLAPATELLMQAAAALPGELVLDIGCGTGETSVIAAQSGAQVTGVDISEPMLSLARTRLGDSGTTLLADASKFQSDVKYDLVLSRFGVMFFDDPVGAFSNIRKNLKSGGRMAFVCWQSPKANKWVLVPMMAIKPFMPETEPADPHAPGPFAFADDVRLKAILEDAGFKDIDITAHEIDICLTQNGGAEGAVQFTSQIGPAARAIAEVDEDIRPEIRNALAEALKDYDNDGRVSLAGGIWIVTAASST